MSFDAKIVTRDSWIGKAAHEIGHQTSWSGRDCNVEARAMADQIRDRGEDYADYDPRDCARQLFSPQARAARRKAHEDAQRSSIGWQIRAALAAA